MGPRQKDRDIRTPGAAGETVVALFDDQAAAERGIQSLTAAGFTEQQSRRGSCPSGASPS